MTVTHLHSNIDNWSERVDLAAAFRWTARLNMHEAVANHFSLAINDAGTRFLMNPNQVHFARIKASDLIVVDATVLASLADSSLPPIDQNSAAFFNRYVIDDHYGGLAFEQEGKRCAQLLTDPRKKVLIMGNHGVMIIGNTVAETFNRLFYFERAAETYIRALQTGRPLRVLSDEVAEKAARELEEYPGQSTRHLNELKAILDDEGSNYSQ